MKETIMSEEVPGVYWTHEFCGRNYTDATLTEIAAWETRMAATGYCCDDCEEEAKEKQ